MAERQKHGFDFQKKMCSEKNLKESSEYIGRWDAFDSNNYPCVIKTFKKGSEIPLSDIFINSSRNENFRMIFGVWNNSKANIVEVFDIMIDGKKFTKLFEFQSYNELKMWIKNVSNDRSYDKIWKQECQIWKTKWGKTRLVQPRFKRDHKSQKRIQSAVSYKNIERFIEVVGHSNIVSNPTPR